MLKINLDYEDAVIFSTTSSETTFFSLSTLSTSEL